MASPNTPTSPASTQMPTRSSTLASSLDEGAVPDEDTSEVTKLFHERLQAWKHACGYFEAYIESHEKLHRETGKEYEKVLKTVSNPLKEGHHFAQNLGGVAGMFDNIRSNTQGMSNSHAECAKTLKGSVLPIFERLHTEIKNKTKELMKGAGKGSKLVDKARAATQKQIEHLGTNTAGFDSTGGKVNAADDPYVVQRHVYHLLNKQVIEENNNRNDLIAVQNNFAQFEAHVIAQFQEGLNQFMQVVNGQAQQKSAMYNDMLQTGQQITPDFEWNGFVQRNNQILIDPNAPPRTVSQIGFANQDHRGTKPLIAGSLERKGKIMKRYDTNYYVVTPSKFLHEFTTDDDFSKPPNPEMSYYLPDCVIGAAAGQKFNVKGKDVGKGSVGNKFSMSHELQFKAHTAADAEQWWNVIRNAAGQVTDEAPGSTPITPASRQTSNNFPPTESEKKEAAQAQENAEAPQAQESGTTAPGEATPAPEKA